MASDIPDFAACTPSQAPSSPSSSPNARTQFPRASRVSPAQSSSPFELTSSGALKLNYAAQINPSEDEFTYYPLHPFTTPGAEIGGTPQHMSPFRIPRRQPMLGSLDKVEPPPDIVLRIGNHLVTESSKLTPALVGERFVEPTLIDYKGRKCLVFVFGVRFLISLLLVVLVQRLTAFSSFVPVPSCLP